MNNDLNDRISDYLSDQMNAEDRVEFEREMASNPGIANQVAFERDLAQALQSHGAEQALRENLQRISARFDSPESLFSAPEKSVGSHPWKWWLMLLGLALTGALLIWFSLLNNHPNVANTPPEPVAPTLESDTVHPEQPTENDADNGKTPVKKQPMAAVFRPIPALESYIGSQTRNGGLHFRVKGPASNSTLSLINDRVAFQLQGKVAGQIPADASYRVLIFNNNRQAFEAMQPLESIALTPTPQGDFYIQKTLYLAKGLHYFLIEEIASGEWMYVDKFLVL